MVTRQSRKQAVPAGLYQFLGATRDYLFALAAARAGGVSGLDLRAKGGVE